MNMGPREPAHREYGNDIIARDAVLKYGINSVTYKLAEARLTAAVRSLPEPSPHWD
jgi:hypothetical protein